MRVSQALEAGTVSLGYLVDYRPISSGGFERTMHRAVRPCCLLMPLAVICYRIVRDDRSVSMLTGRMRLRFFLRCG